jgi:hypothetical protein
MRYFNRHSPGFRGFSGSGSRFLAASFARLAAAAGTSTAKKVTGARADRRELQRMLGKLAPGDVVTVTRIDRLARSTFDLFAFVKRIVRPRRNSDRWPSRGPTAAAALGARSQIGASLLARQDLRAVEVAPVGNDIEALCLERVFRLLGYAGELRPVVADIGHLVRDDQMMLGVHQATREKREA